MPREHVTRCKDQHGEAGGGQVGCGRHVDLPVCRYDGGVADVGISGKPFEQRFFIPDYGELSR